MEKKIEWWIDFAGYKMGELTEKEISQLEPVRTKLIDIMNKEAISDNDFNEVFNTLEKINTTEKYSRISEDDMESKNLLDYSVSDDVKKAIVNYQKQRKRELTEDAGQIIREKREEKNLTLATVSSLLGVSSSYLSKIENSSRRIPSSEVLDGICELLEISKSDLVNYKEEGDEKFVLKPEKTLDALLYFNNIKGISNEDRDGLATLIHTIVDLEWSDVSRALDASNLINAVTEYKKKKKK